MLLHPIPDGQRAATLPTDEAGQTPEDVQQTDLAEAPLERARMLAGELARVLSLAPAADPRDQHELQLASSLAMHVLDILEGLGRTSRPPPVDAE
jgi:hypothetical protein